MNTVIDFVNILVTILTLAIFVRAITSWFPVDPSNRFIIILYQITDPILNPIRKLVPPIGGTIDITPILAIVLLQLIAHFVAQLA